MKKKKNSTPPPMGPFWASLLFAGVTTAFAHALIDAGVTAYSVVLLILIFCTSVIFWFGKFTNEW